jgi:CheY-like chemotaxis protein
LWWCPSPRIIVASNNSSNRVNVMDKRTDGAPGKAQTEHHLERLTEALLALQVELRWLALAANHDDAATQALTERVCGDPAELDARQLLSTRFAGMRVLLAEDEPMSAKLLRTQLEDVGFVVDTAEDGQAALECAASVAYPLIVMDRQMPRMNGLEATRAIRQLPAHAKTPIIACTANATLDDRWHCMAAGMNGFVTKPPLPATLYKAIAGLLHTPQAA